MKKIKYTLLTIFCVICIAMIILFINNNNTLKINEISINDAIFQLTNNTDDYSKYKKIEDFKIYNNNTNFEIEIQNPNIVTYKNIKVGDSVDKLKFCNKTISNTYYFETNYKYNGYYMGIIYGEDPFDNTIISITYRFFKKQ